MSKPHKNNPDGFPKWISGKDIIKEKGINTLELLKLVGTGSPHPHDKNYNPVPPLHIQKKINDLEEYERRLEYIKEFLPFCQPDAPDLIDKLQDMADEGIIIDPQTFSEVGLDALYVFTPENLEKLREEEERVKKTLDVLKMELSGVLSGSWAGCHLPDNEYDQNSMINYLLNSLFKLSEVEKTIKHLQNEATEQELDHIPTEKKQRPNQIAKTECRKIAQKLWSEDPTTTIVDMIVSDEISNACLEIAKKTFTEKILREWVKDLCPDRSPGRRPGT